MPGGRWGAYLQDADVVRLLTRLEVTLGPVGLTAFAKTVMTPYMRERARARFANEGDDAVGQWMPLQEATWNFREEQGFPPDHPINKRTGRLEAYITGGGVGVTPTPDGALLTFPDQPPTGETARKLETAQYGKNDPYTPSRPVLGISEVDVAFAVTALADFIERGGAS